MRFVLLVLTLALPVHARAQLLYTTPDSRGLYMGGGYAWGSGTSSTGLGAGFFSKGVLVSVGYASATAPDAADLAGMSLSTILRLPARDERDRVRAAVGLAVQVYDVGVFGVSGGIHLLRPPRGDAGFWPQVTASLNAFRYPAARGWNFEDSAAEVVVSPALSVGVALGGGSTRVTPYIEPIVTFFPNERQVLFGIGGTLLIKPKH